MKQKKNKKPKSSTPKVNLKVKTSKRRFNYQHGFALIVLLATLICYWPAFNNDFLAYWDDITYVTQNDMVTSLSAKNLKRIISEPVSLNYHPVTMLSLALDYSFDGLNPKVFHTTNVIIHLLCTLAVFYFVFLLTGRNLWIASFASLWFGIHPMHVESVAWISERKDVLYGLFYFLAGITYLKYLSTNNRKYYIATLPLFLLSVLSKAMAVSFPLILILIDLLKGRKLNKTSLLEKLPFFLMALFFGILAIKIQSQEAISEFDAFSLIERICFASYGFLLYLIKVFVPLKLSAFYPYPNVNDSGMMPAVYYLAAAIAIPFLSYLAYAAFRQIRKGASPIQSYFNFSYLFYFFNLILVLQLLSVGNAIMAERYSYVSYVGIFIFIGFLLHQLQTNIQLKSFRIPLFVALFLLSGWFAVTTFQRTAIWNNSESLWTDVIEKYPMRVETAYKNRGSFFREQGKIDQAFQDYQVLLQMNVKDAQVYSSLGNIYGMRNDYPKALEMYDRSVIIDPNYFFNYLNRGITYSMMGRSEQAIQDFSQALKIDPDSKAALENRAKALLDAGNYNDAFKDFETLLRQNPNDQQSYFQRGLAYFKTGNHRKALQDFLQVVAMNPSNSDALYNCSAAYFNLGNFQKAKDFALQAKAKGFNVNPSYLQSIESKL